MPRGINENKRRNADSRDAMARREYYQEAARRMPAIRVVREDLATGAVREISRSAMSSEICWLLTFAPPRNRPCVLPADVAWESLRDGATLYAGNRTYRLGETR